MFGFDSGSTLPLSSRPKYCCCFYDKFASECSRLNTCLFFRDNDTAQRNPGVTFQFFMVHKIALSYAILIKQTQ